MGYIKLDNIVRSAIANKGKQTLHLYVPYLHWAFKGLRKFQEEGFYTDLKSTKDFLDADNCLPFPSDMMMWNKIGIVSNGVVQTFVNDQSLSLDPKDHNNVDNAGAFGLFGYDTNSVDILYTTSVYVSTENGVVAVGAGVGNSFKVNWAARKFQIKKKVAGTKIYLEYTAKVHDPTTQTLVNELAEEYLESFIYYREARFKFGAAHRETLGAEREWLNAEDDLAASLSDLTAGGIMRALSKGTRKTIDQ